MKLRTPIWYWETETNLIRFSTALPDWSQQLLFLCGRQLVQLTGLTSCYFLRTIKSDPSLRLYPIDGAGIIICCFATKLQLFFLPFPFDSPFLIPLHIFQSVYEKSHFRQYCESSFRIMAFGLIWIKLDKCYDFVECSCYTVHFISILYRHNFLGTIIVLKYHPIIMLGNETQGTKWTSIHMKGLGNSFLFPVEQMATHT